MIAFVFPLPLLLPIHLLWVCLDNAIVLIIKPLNSTILGNKLIFNNYVALRRVDVFSPLFPSTEDLLCLLCSWKNLDINTILTQFQAFKVCIIPYPSTCPWLLLISARIALFAQWWPTMVIIFCSFLDPHYFGLGWWLTSLIFPAPFCISNAKNFGRTWQARAQKTGACFE